VRGALAFSSPASSTTVVSDVCDIPVNTFALCAHTKMGTGRKNQNYSHDGHNAQGGGRPQPPPHMNLGDELGGVIFGATSHTLEECMEGLIFGLPSAHWKYVQYIQVGMPVFLFNYTDKQLYGVFKAASDGEMNINPRGWVDPEEPEDVLTRYPAQVRVNWHAKCRPAKLYEFKPIIEDLYYTESHFHFELTTEQASKLVNLFMRKLGSNGAPSKPTPKTFTPSAPPAMPAWGAASSNGLSMSKAAIAPAPAPARSHSDAHNPSPEYDYENDYEYDSNYAPESAEEAAATKLSPAARPFSTPAPQHPPPPQGGAALPNGTASTPVFPPLRPAASQPPSQRTTVSNARREAPHVYASAAMPATAAAAAAQPSGSASSPIEGNLPLTQQFMQSLTQGLSHMHHELTMMKAQKDTSAMEARMQYMEKEVACLKKTTESLEAGMAELRGHLIAVSMGKVPNVKPLTIMPKVQHQPPPPPNAPAVREDGPSYAVPVNRASNPAALAHPPPKLADSIFICGGLSARGKVFLKESHCYSPGKSTFEPIAPLNEARAYGAAVCMNRQIILMGGGSHNQCTSSVECYSMDHNEWRFASPLAQPRQNPAACALGDKVYLLGGGVATALFDNVDVYHPDTNRWFAGPALSSKRFALTAAVLDNVVYCIGGNTGAAYANSMERYDPRICGWQSLCSMRTKRGAAGSCVLNGELFVIGGFDGVAVQDTVEVYEPRANAWRETSNMRTKRAFISTCLADGDLYTYGGLTHDSQEVSVEKYNRRTNSWDLVQMPESAGDIHSNVNFSAVCSTAK